MRTFRNILLVIIALGAVGLYYFGTGNFSEGERTGRIDKFSEKGFIFKTWEGDLKVGANAEINPKMWSFSVKAGADSVIAKIQEAQRSQTRVSLKYDEKYVGFPWNGDTKYFITDVLFSNDAPATPAAPAPAAATQSGPKIDTIRQVVIIDTIRK